LSPVATSVKLCAAKWPGQGLKFKALIKGIVMLTRFGTAIALLLGVAFSHQAFADTIKGESHDRKMTGTQKGGGGGGAGKTQSKPTKRMLNPQPEPPGRR